ncbi:glycerate kinase [Niabella sp. W65]|nr:glycerate kinase [Niabella sp. W65]MCH7361883.1 glycerate kinase [Niabella sp. W65]
MRCKNKLLGTKGAARIFGPQKGATAENMASLQKKKTATP